MSESAVGHNNPPEPTEYEKIRDRMEDLWIEAVGWLDGDPIATQGQADALSNLLNMLRDARKGADEIRKEEARPFDEGKKAVQAKFKPLLDKADLATETAKKALTPWLIKVAAEKKAADDKAMAEAEAERRAAEEAVRATADNLADRAAADEALKASKKAEAIAKKESKTTAKSGGDFGRAVSLRTTYKPQIVDKNEAVKYYWKTDEAEILRFILTLAARDVANGKRTIPGFEIQEIKTAV